MRIVQACPYAWDAPGGVQVHVRQLAEHLRGRGHDVLVVAPAYQPARAPGLRTVGKPIRIPYNGSVAPISPRVATLRAVGGALEEFEPDLVHVHEPFTPSASMAAVLKAHVPVVGTFHAFGERSRLLDVAAPLLRPVWRRIAVRAAGINYADLMARSGAYPDAPPPPCVVGYEVAGEVESVGEGVEDLDAEGAEHGGVADA